jgi:ribonuclease P protein component
MTICSSVLWYSQDGRRQDKFKRIGFTLKKFSLPKKKRLVSNNQFKDVLAHGHCARNNLLVLYAAKNNLNYSRLGVSVGKIHGNAVVRNRLKRLLREVFRQSQDSIPSGFDYLLMISGPKETIRDVTFMQIKNSFSGLIDLLLSDRRLREK